MVQIYVWNTIQFAFSLEFPQVENLEISIPELDFDSRFVDVAGARCWYLAPEFQSVRYFVPGEKTLESQTGVYKITY